ncbi:hypothetical protein VNO80_09096 [Phaseolus coccineus]|uniref:ACB domain-containing protein n=1 Tax=Phaseolus coccineus TaxID=3886 RepID=A0AAN9NAT8_PHACN
MESLNFSNARLSVSFPDVKPSVFGVKHSVLIVQREKRWTQMDQNTRGVKLFSGPHPNFCNYKYASNITPITTIIGIIYKLTKIQQPDQSLCFPTKTLMGLQEDFEQYAEKAKTLPPNQTNENLLIIYGLYKQATVGDVNTARPGMFNMKDRAKWDAWKAVEGKSKEVAMNDYITKVKQLLEEAGMPA